MSMYMKRPPPPPKKKGGKKNKKFNVTFCNVFLNGSYWKDLINHDLLHVLYKQLFAKYKIIGRREVTKFKIYFSNKIFNNHESD